MSTSPRVQSLTLEQFTAFENAKFDFCEGINVLIGANATGKSHVMKAIYSLSKVPNLVYQSQIPSQDRVDVITSSFRAIFQSLPENLVRYGEDLACIGLDYKKTLSLGLRISQTGDILLEDRILAKWDRPDIIYQTYLPPQEFLSHSPGFIAAYERRELTFDATYYDFCVALNALPLRPHRLTDLQHVITFLRTIIAGESLSREVIVTQENRRFKFLLPEGELDAELVAEGYRKIATLLYLIRNGSLTQDSVLFWDEPEANLNPKLIVEVVKVLHMLAQAGMQIFITTHDYLLSHELSLLAEYPAQADIDLRFFALHRPDRFAGVEVETGQTLAELQHNPILEEFAAHYDRESALFSQATTSGE